MRTKRKPESQGKEVTRVWAKKKLGSQSKKKLENQSKRKPGSQGKKKLGSNITYSWERKKV